MKKEVRKCAECGKKFSAKQEGQKYCSAKCRKVAKREIERRRRADAKKAKAAKKVVKTVCKQKVTLPKKPTKAVVAKPTEHVIRRGDIVKFANIEPARALRIGLSIAVMALKDLLK